MTPSFFAISSAYCLTRPRSVGGRVAALSVRDLVVDCSCSAGPADWLALPGTPAPAPAMAGAQGPGATSCDQRRPPGQVKAEGTRARQAILRHVGRRSETAGRRGPVPPRRDTHAQRGQALCPAVVRGEHQTPPGQTATVCSQCAARDASTVT